MSKAIRDFVREILAEGVYDPGILKAVFLAGGPGSGKSYTAKIIFGADPANNLSVMTASGLKMVNSDPAFEKFVKDMGVDLGQLGHIIDTDPEMSRKLGVRPDEPPGPDTPRGKAKRVKGLSMHSYTRPNSRLGVIIDGTGRVYSKIESLKKGLEEKGYDTFMVFVNTSLEVAQKRNQERSRKLSKDLVKNSWTDVQTNMGKYQNLFGAENMIVVDNTVYGPIHKDSIKAVNKFVSSPVKNRIGKAWIEKELDKKGPKARLPKRKSGGF